MRTDLKDILTKVSQEIIQLNEKILRAEEEGNRAFLEPIMSETFFIIRASGVMQNRAQYIDAVSMNKNRERTIAQSNIQLHG
jgi:hypothetical protein